MQRGNNGKKYCPRCGTQNNISDAYCIKCGFAFVSRRKRSGFGVFLTILILAIVAWFFYRTLMKQPLIPEEMSSILKNLTLPKLK